MGDSHLTGGPLIVRKRRDLRPNALFSVTFFAVV